MLSKIKTIESLYSKGIIKINLEYLKIKKFRNFDRDLWVNFNHPLTVLVGKNGSGKSTFLKIIKSIPKGKNASHYFFETEWDKFNDGEIAEFQYKIRDKEYKEIKTKHFGWIFSQLERDLSSNILIKQYLDNQEPKENFSVIDIEFKSLIGSFEKNVFFDNQTTKIDLESKVEYARRVTKKVQQSIETKTSSGKKSNSININAENIKSINLILGKKYEEIKIIHHKFFNGTWGTSIIFKADNQYSEANAGSGEFIISNLIQKLSSISANSILLLDEPELSLHPGAQKRLFFYILDLIIKKKLQVILSTHSPSFIELVPSNCIKNFIVKIDNKITIEQNINYLSAFKNLELSYDVPTVIVEDELAKKIVEKIINNEKMSDQFNVCYFSGGASSIKTSLITTFSKVNDTNRFFILDGDMYICEVIDLSTIPELEKTTKYLEKEITKITNINIKKFIFNVDGGENGSNENQKNELYRKYIDFYKDKVFFMPEKIPEDIIYNEEYLKTIFPSVNLELVNSSSNSKAKFKNISEQLDITVDVLYEVFTKNYVINRSQSESYKLICENLKRILILNKSIQ